MKFFIRTLGCKLNQLDSARLAGALARAGHERAASEEEAEWVLVNTCTVTGESDRKSRQAAHGVARAHRGLVVLGCSARVDAERWRAAMPEALVFADDAELLAHFRASGEDLPFPLTSRTRLPVVVQTGCDERCAFCITRVARGPHVSLPAAEVVRQVAEAEARGVSEVVLTGVNLGAWGCATTRRPGGTRLPELLERLLRETGVPRIRLSSLGPQYLTPAFFDAWSDPRVCDHLHLSVQSGSPAVLARMERGHGVPEVLAAVEAARRTRPDAALTADLIAGLPGETPGEHAETLRLAQGVGFARLHVFPYSAREGTPAASMPGQVPVAVRKARAGELRRLGDRTRAAFVRSQLGRRAHVLAETDGTGLTTNYLRLRVPGVPEGELTEVEVTPETLADRG